MPALRKCKNAQGQAVILTEDKERETPANKPFQTRPGSGLFVNALRFAVYYQFYDLYCWGTNVRKVLVVLAKCCLNKDDPTWKLETGDRDLLERVVQGGSEDEYDPPPPPWGG